VPSRTAAQDLPSSQFFSSVSAGCSAPYPLLDTALLGEPAIHKVADQISPHAPVAWPVSASQPIALAGNPLMAAVDTLHVTLGHAPVQQATGLRPGRHGEYGLTMLASDVLIWSLVAYGDFAAWLTVCPAPSSSKLDLPLSCFAWVRIALVC